MPTNPVNPEIRKLQYLNDLIAQTLDVINQRAMLMAGGGLGPSIPEIGLPALSGLHPLSQVGVPPHLQMGVGVGVPYIGGTAGPLGMPWGVGVGQQMTPFGPQTPFAQQGAGYAGGISPWGIQQRFPYFA